MKYQWLMFGSGALPDVVREPLLHFGEFVEYEKWRSDPDAFSENCGSMLLINCAGESGEELAACKDFLKSMLEKNRPALLIKPTGAFKASLVQDGILSCCIQDDSFALFLEPCRDENGNLRIALSEHFGVVEEGLLERVQVVMDQTGKILTSKKDSFPVKNTAGLNFMDLDPFIQHIRHVMHELSKGNTIPFSDSAPNNPPSDVPSNLWVNTPINVYQVVKPKGSAVNSYTPPPGTVTVEFLISVGIYYDNKKYSKPVQWVYLEHSGHVHTDMQHNDRHTRGWSIGEFNVSGDNISSSEFVSNSSSPNNVSEKKSYTSSSELDVGLQAGTQGIQGDISYHIGSSETVEISDWKVVQKDPNSWQMFQATPYNGTAWSFPNGCAGYHGANSVPTISSSTLAFNTQSTWIHNPAVGNETKRVAYTYNMKNHYVWCDSYSKSSWHAWWWGFRSWPSRTILLNFSQAYPK